MKIALPFIALLFSTSALAQQTILQGGPFTRGHAPMYAGQGSSQPVVQDSGTAAGGAAGVGLSELGIAARGTGTPPYAGLGTGPLGTNVCDYDGPITAAAGYHYLCLSANAQGGGLIAYGSGGAATALPLYFSINGELVQFPGSGNGDVVGPASSVIGHLASFNNTAGNLIADTGYSIGSFILSTGATAIGQPALSTAGPNWASPASSIYDVFRLAVNSFPANAQIGFNIVPIVEGIVAGIDVPNTSIGGNATNSIAGYGRTASTSTGAVGVLGVGLANADTTSQWGANFIVTNAPTFQAATNNGHTATNGYGIEVDVEMRKESDGSTPGSTMRGIYIVGASTIAPSNPIFEAIGIDSPGIGQSPVIKWNNGIYTYDGSTGIALNIGQTSQGSNSGSQQINFRATNVSAVAKNSTIQLDPDGNLIILPNVSAGVDISNAASFTSNANAVDILTFNGSVANGVPTIAATGSDTNIAVSLSSKGTDPVNFFLNSLVSLGLSLRYGDAGENAFVLTNGINPKIDVSGGHLVINPATTMNSAVTIAAGGLTVSASGITVTGNSTITGTLGGLTGLTVASGGITVTGNSTITGTLGGLTGLTVASGGVTATGNSSITGTLNVTAGYSINGAAGLTQTCTVNTASPLTLIFTNGILTGGTCNS